MNVQISSSDTFSTISLSNKVTDGDTEITSISASTISSSDAIDGDSVTVTEGEDADNDASTVSLEIQIPDDVEIDWSEVEADLSALGDVSLDEFMQELDAAITAQIEESTSTTSTETNSLLAEGTASRKLYDILTSGNYPDITEFLKVILDAAQEVRVAEREATQASAMAEYDVTMSQADLARDAAKDTYQAAMHEINGMIAGAVTKMVTGAITLVAAGISFATCGSESMQVFSMINGAQTSVGTSISDAVQISEKFLQAKEEKSASIKQAESKELDAIKTLIQDAQSMSTDMSAKMKELVNAVLSLIGSSLQETANTIREANKV